MEKVTRGEKKGETKVPGYFVWGTRPERLNRGTRRGTVTVF
jgi:hypothetical protein